MAMEMDNKSISKMATLTPAVPVSALKKIPEENIGLSASYGATTDKNAFRNFKIKKLTLKTGLKGGGTGTDAKTHNKAIREKNVTADNKNVIFIDLTSDNENEDCRIKGEKVDIDKCPKEQPLPDAKVKNDSQTSADASSNSSIAIAESSKKVVKKLSKTHEDLIAYRDIFIKNLRSFSKLRLNMTAIECRSVRIGSYKIVVAETNKITVNIYERGICFELPHVTDNEENKMVTCALPYHTIMSIYAHFDPKFPVLFIKTSPLNADWLQEKLGMGNTPEESFYYHPEKGGITQQTITFLTKPFSKSDISIMKNLFPYNLIAVDHSTANNMLMDINPDTRTLNSAQLVRLRYFF